MSSRCKRGSIKGTCSPRFGIMQLCFGSPRRCSSTRNRKKNQNRAAKFVNGNYCFETWSMTGILEKLKWESIKKRRRNRKLILFYKCLKGAAIIPTDNLNHPFRHIRNHLSLTFQTPAARTDIYKGSFFPQTIRDWNTLPDSTITSAEGAEDDVARFTLWWELGINSLYHRSWWMNVIRRITSKNSEILQNARWRSLSVIRRSFMLFEFLKPCWQDMTRWRVVFLFHTAFVSCVYSRRKYSQHQLLLKDFPLQGESHSELKFRLCICQVLYQLELFFAEVCQNLHCPLECAHSMRRFVFFFLARSLSGIDSHWSRLISQEFWSSQLFRAPILTPSPY